MTETTTVDDFKLLDPATLAEPYQYWSALREQAPVHSVDEGAGFTIVTRYADVQAALRQPEVFSSQLSRRFLGGMSAYEDSPAVAEVMSNGCPYSDALAFSDGELHSRHRSMVRRGFTLKRVRELESVITDTVNQLIDDLPMGEPVDLWDFCVQVPVRMIGHILGVDAKHAADVKRWGDAQVARFGEPRATEAENLQIAHDLVDFHQYLYRQIAARRTDPRDDFLTDLVQAADGSSDDELVLVLAQLLVAGSESSSSLIGSMVDQLIRHPELMERLRADRSLVPAAVEEALRAESPIKLVYRITTRDVELGGVTIPESTLCLLMVASANRDDATFPESQEFRLDREDNRKHFAFGMGTHLCSGAELARAEGRIALDLLLDRTSRIERGGEEPVHPPNLTVRALHDFKVVLYPA